MRWIPVAAAACVILGAILFLQFYYVRVKRIQLEHRQQMIDWRWYTWLDHLLKLTAIGITLISLLTDWQWLARWHHHHPAIIAMGLLIAGLGLVYFVTAIIALGEHYSDAHQGRLPTAIIQRGPYRYVRHPIYSANLVLTIGLLIVSGSAWLAINLLVLSTYYYVMIRKEEAYLLTAFPEYHTYRQRTGALLPRIFPPQKLFQS